MQLKCPVCKAETATETCRRCKADLSMLFALERQREVALSLARRHLRCWRWVAACDEARRADELRRDAETQQVLALASLMCGDYAMTLRCWRRGAE